MGGLAWPFATSPAYRYIQRHEEAMPEPDYNSGDPPSLIVFICGTVVVVLLFLIIKSCVW